MGGRILHRLLTRGARMETIEPAQSAKRIPSPGYDSLIPRSASRWRHPASAASKSSMAASVSAGGSTSSVSVSFDVSTVSVSGLAICDDSPSSEQVQ